MDTDVYRTALDDARREFAEAIERRDALEKKAEEHRIECNRLMTVIRCLRDLLGETEPSDETLAFIPQPPQRRKRKGQ